MSSEQRAIRLTAAQRRVVVHRAGPMMVTGPAGAGRSEALAQRLGSLAKDGVEPHRVLVLTRSRAAAAGLRARAEAFLDQAREDLWVATYEQVAERLLREHALAAGIDPFFATVEPADRLAIMLDRLDELPLRRHEIRGNPAGLLARLLRRVDVLQAEAVTPADLRDWAVELERGARTEAERERARRELEFAELFARHERILRDADRLDAGSLVLELSRVLRDRPDVRESVAGRFPHVMADELEEAGAAHRRLLEALAPHGNLVCACDPRQAVRRKSGQGGGSAMAFVDLHPDAERVELDRPQRFGVAVARAAAAVIGEAGDEPTGPAREEAESPVRFWRCRSERAQAQAAAREIEALLGGGEVRTKRICVIAEGGWREARQVAAALEERSVPFRFAGDAAFFGRAEVRDVLAWLRMLADPGDTAAVVRALTRPPVELRSVDLARCTTIARRRKLDMVSALEAALGSPQLPPEARDRIQAFLKLYRGAADALEIRADVFVRRLIERIGLRRQRLFAASPETAERLVNLSRLAELAADWSRREPRGSTRGFIRHLTAVADAGDLGDDDCDVPAAGSVVVAEAAQTKGLEFDHVFLLGLRRGGLAGRPHEEEWIPERLFDHGPGAADAHASGERGELAYLAITRARRALVLARPETVDDSAVPASPIYEAARRALGGDEEVQEEELFGPAEGLHSTYRMVRDEVLESSWRAGSALSEMRLDTAHDVNQAVARYLELIKLAALIQRPGGEPASEALAAIGELLGRVASPEQRAALETSALDAYVAGEERERDARREVMASRREPSLESFIPRRGDGGEGLALSASDIDLYRICPLKYKFARVFAIPQEPTINQRFGILFHQVLERFHSEELRGETAPSGPEPGWGGRPGSIDRLLALFEAG